MALQASGDDGELRKGHHVVARLSSWTLDASIARVDAKAHDIKQFWIDQPPFSLRLRFGKRFWVWSNVEVLDPSERLALRVHGSPDVRD